MIASEPDDDDLISGRYRIISRLGAGGMGVAYRAWDQVAGLPVVIKIPKRSLLDDPKFVERFAREIRLLRGLRHPHIVPIVDVGEHEGLPFVVMQFLPGGSLANRRRRDDEGKARPNPPGMLHLWLPAVAEALDFVHAHGVVHRDVKPANIFFDAFWGAFLGDFGIAKIVEESEAFDREATLTATSMGLGTPDYMAAEQFAPKPLLDGRTDQYALAVTVYEMLAGTRPFTGSTTHIVVELTTQQPPDLNRLVRGLPRTLVDAVHRALAKRPGERFATCREFAAAVLHDVAPLAREADLARLLCPRCEKLLKLPASAAGSKGRCPRCKTEMKVADDLGSLWLLDEVRRQRESTAGVEIASDPDLEFGKVDDESSQDFKPITSPSDFGRAMRRGRQGVTGWIDSHGIAMTAVLGLLAAIPWAILAIRPGGSGEVRTLQEKLRVGASRERGLTREIGQLQAARDNLRKRLADADARHAEAERQVQSLEVRGQALQQRAGDLERQISALLPAAGQGGHPPEKRDPIAPNRSVWINTATDGFFIYDPQRKLWREGNHTVGLASSFSEFSSTPDYVEIRDESRGTRLRLYDEKATVYQPSSNTWRDFKRGKWIGYEEYEALGYPDIATDQKIDTTPDTSVTAPAVLGPPLVNSIGIRFSLIPAGTFQMGSTEGEGEGDERPVRNVRITQPFYLGVTEVTNEQWQAVMGGEPPSKWNDADLPVEEVTWNDAVEFCKKLSARPKERAAGRVYRLPTEAEWEYACRAGTSTTWASGDDEKALEELGWFTINSRGQTHPVGQKQPNAWGLYDMHGNVWEWCGDWYGAYAADVVADPTGPTRGSSRVFRGGSWFITAKNCRSANRDGNDPAYQINDLGFRLALSPLGSARPETGDDRDVEPADRDVGDEPRQHGNQGDATGRTPFRTGGGLSGVGSINSEMSSGGGMGGR